MAFNGQQRFKVQSEDRRIVSGALMVAGLPIYRRDESGEYYVSFTASAIQAIVYKFMKENRTKEVNEMHETDVDGVFLFESFIVDSTRGIRTPDGFDELPDGSWFGSFKVENDEVWAKVKDGTYTGFSVEGLFTQDMEKNIDEKVLAEVITYHAKEFVTILSVAGTEDRLDIGDATLASARKAYAKERRASSSRSRSVAT